MLPKRLQILPKTGCKRQVFCCATTRKQEQEQGKTSPFAGDETRWLWQLSTPPRDQRISRPPPPPTAMYVPPPLIPIPPSSSPLPAIFCQREGNTCPPPDPCPTSSPLFYPPRFRPPLHYPSLPPRVPHPLPSGIPTSISSLQKKTP